jgi:hypothetical protein
VGLGAAVLGVHLLLLTGGVSLPGASPAAPASVAVATPQVMAIEARTFVAETSEPPPVSLSTVRWLAPPAPEPVAAPPKRPPQIVAAPRVRPPAPERPMPEPPEAKPPTSETALGDTSLPTVATEPVAPAEPAADGPVAPDPAAQTPALPELVAAQESPEPFAQRPPDVDDELALAARRSQPATPRGETRLPPAQPPASAQLKYDVEGKAKGLQYSASGVLDWTRSDSAYSARMEIRVFLLGSRVQTSQGAVVATGLQPERFGDKSRNERAAHFDRALGRIRFSNNAPDAELLPGAQDRLSVFFQLAGLLNARPEAYAAGQSVAIPVAGTGGSEVWRFEMQGLESLTLPAGELLARHLVRQPRQAYDTRVDIWLAPSLGHLPVRIRITHDNGDVVDQRLSALP